MSGQCQVNGTVCGERIHQLVLKDIQPVTESNNDIAAQILFGLQEQTVRTFRRMAGRQEIDLAVNLRKAVLRQE